MNLDHKEILQNSLKLMLGPKRCINFVPLIYNHRGKSHTSAKLTCIHNSNQVVRSQFDPIQSHFKNFVAYYGTYTIENVIDKPSVLLKLIKHYPDQRLYRYTKRELIGDLVRRSVVDIKREFETERKC